MSPRPRRAALALAAALLLTACSSESSGEGPTGALSTLAPGDPVDDVELAVLSLEDAGAIDMGELGGPAVINFWATWCAFCVDEMPDFEAVHQEVADQVRFVGVAREELNVERALAFADEIGVTYELVEDPEGDFFRASRGRGMPTTLFVDASGIIRYRHAGPMDAEVLRELLAEHLDIGAA